uniref:Tc3 transposase DNA binding domain-containing protein n=1 Tax=Strigamia maritima TaxID=126957 RepID=T1IW74_STRMM
MGASKKLTEAEKSKIDAYKELGLSNVKIGKKIERFKKIIRNYLRLGANYGLENPGGHPKSTSIRTRNLVIRKASNKCTSACAIKSECDLNRSVRTIQRILKKHSSPKIHKTKKETSSKASSHPSQIELGRKEGQCDYDESKFWWWLSDGLGSIWLQKKISAKVFVPWAKVLSRTMQT